MPLAEVLSSRCDESLTWPLPGGGATADRWRRLAELAHADLVLGRLVEAHADAIAILAELGGPLPERGQRWGVWAAGPVDLLRASPTGDGWVLEGTKPWCSGATLVTHALVTAADGADQRLFSVDLAAAGVAPADATWSGLGMAGADTRTVLFHRARAAAVANPGQYLQRPGFWVGAVGVAACWHGGAVHAAAPLLRKAGASADPHLLAHLGAVHCALATSRAVLYRAAAAVDADPLGEHQVLAQTVRAVVERSCADVLTRLGRALGPGPLAHDGAHSALVADLTVYLRQHHAERDLEALGTAVAGLDPSWLL